MIKRYQIDTPDQLRALYALHPQALTVEEAGADDLLALAQEGETP